MMRLDPNLRFERRFWKGGWTYVAGLDEAGRGALAGPIAVGAVILPPPGHPALQNSGRRVLRGVRDSKQMTAPDREAAAERIRAHALAYSVGFASSDEIDSHGIVAAGRLAALRALEGLALLPDALLTDFRLELPELDIPQTSLVKGDVRCLSIAAASVLAKTARDALMFRMDSCIPGYGLAQHKGYGTRLHRKAIQRMGRSPIHRRTFSVSS
ncbi:MAG TPA: ribonuclease HII [Anaerolineales bacterium]|nr:ribonuclease HII [Anaerolineales bacterium]